MGQSCGIMVCGLCGFSSKSCSVSFFYVMNILGGLSSWSTIMRWPRFAAYMKVFRSSGWSDLTI